MSGNSGLEAWFRTLRRPGFPDEFEAKELLRSYGAAVPEGIRLEPGEDPAPAASLSPPYAVKVCSPDVLHKTERGGVKTGVDENGLAGAIAELAGRFSGEALLVEEMVSFDGPEFIIGGLVDPDFGLAVMAGAGGILAEIYSDVVFRLVPVDVPEARRMLKGLRVAPVLDGFRGSSLDAGGMAELISLTGRIMERMGHQFWQIDLNPVVFSRRAWTVLDAKIILRSAAEGAADG